MSNKKNNNKKTAPKQNNNIIKNVIFTVVVIVIVIVIFVLSSKIEKKEKDIFNFNISEYENITSIGLYEFEASFNHDGISVFFFCSTEDEKCQKEIMALNEVGKENKISFEYINVVELVDSEIERLENISDIFKKQKYPYLLIMKSGEIVNNNNTYLEKDDIEQILKDNKAI